MKSSLFIFALVFSLSTQAKLASRKQLILQHINLVTSTNNAQVLLEKLKPQLNTEAFQQLNAQLKKSPDVMYQARKLS